MAFSRSLWRACILGVSVLTAVAWPDSIVYSSGFQIGDLNGWTPFNTGNGTVGVTMPTVVPFTINNVSTPVAEFEVGQVNYEPGDSEGGGIEQSLVLPSGQMTLSADVTFYDASIFSNDFAGEAILLMDNQPVATYTAANLSYGQADNETLSYTFTGNGQPTTFGVEFVRPALAEEDLTPYQMVDDIVVVGNGPIGGDPDDPEPATWILAGTALGAVAWWRRKRLA
jgi:hypothetical protein